LGPGILDPEIGRCVGPGSSTPLPTPVVRSDVAIDQLLHKILFSLHPMNVQIFGQEHRCDHSDPIVHKAGRIQFSHSSVDDRKTGASVAPTLEGGRIVVPT
jgi:hypothetical protein